MRKSEIIGADFRRKVEVESFGRTYTIRELSSFTRRELFRTTREVREADHASPEEADFKANEHFNTMLVFESVVDDDGKLVFETDEERTWAVSADGMPDSWWADITTACLSMLGILKNTNETDGAGDDADQEIPADPVPETPEEEAERKKRERAAKKKS